MRRLPEGAREVLARQAGVISRQQAVTQGVTDSQIRTRLANGEWRSLRPGVFGTSEHAVSTTAALHAAILWAGPRAYVSGAAAAWWWHLTDLEPTTIEITAPPNTRRRSSSGVKITRRILPYQDRAFSRAVPVTGLALTALHGAVALGHAGPAMLDRALQRTVDFPSVRQAHYRNLGCWGSREAGQLLQAAGDGAAATSERMLITALRAAGVHGWRANRAIDVGGTTVMPDLSFVTEKIAIEVDGWAWHHTPDRFQRDRERQNRLVSAGWLVLRFTWFDLTERLPSVVAQIRAAVSQRR